MPAPVPPVGREAQLEAEVKQLREMVDRLSRQVDRLSATQERMSMEAAAAPPATTPAPGPAVERLPASVSATGDPRGTMSGTSPKFPVTMPSRFEVNAGAASFGPGFQIQTDDEEYQLQLHNLTQFDGRFYTERPQVSVQDTFVVPRQWFIMSGRLTKPFEYYVSTAEGFDTLNILDIFLNVHFDDRLQFKIGRYKTPFTYEFYSLPINGLISPERSLFFNNFGVNRDLGIMAWGNMLRNRFEYAWGVFNGTRNGFLDANNYKDTMGLINIRPFINNDGGIFQNLTIGGSYDYGIQDSAPIPKIFRTNVATTGNLTVGVEFLGLNNNVKEFGDRAFWTLHVANYYQRLSFIAEWQSGFQDYSLTSVVASRVQVPVDSFYVQAGYFLTGETVTGRGILKPLHPFDVRKGKFGLGAFELTGRYDYMNIGREVFTHGLADGNLWTNRIQTIDVGVNWYWTQAIKVYLGWQLALFGNPVLFEPGRYENDSNQLWVRWQLFF